MLGRCLLAGLGGLGCGVANGAHLLFVLRTIAMARGIWRILLSASWLVLALWPAPVVMFVVMPRVIGREGDQGLCFVLCWVSLSAAAFLWCLRTHPNPLQLDWRSGDRGGGQSPSPACSVGDSAVAKRDAVGSERASCAPSASRPGRGGGCCSGSGRRA